MIGQSFFKILKSELIDHQKYQPIKQAELEVFQFIEGWYNRKRIHQYLGYLTPEQFRRV
ncbi:MAG: IS3 family transposase [Flammeovirgaceae bacterium]|nr:IS3 family transposase [Flammeovirgaceae bacterium]